MWKAGLLLLASATGAQAAGCNGAALQFVESAPRDRFELSIGADVLRSVTVDLRGSKGELIFSTAGGGRRVRVAI